MDERVIEPLATPDKRAPHFLFLCMQPHETIHDTISVDFVFVQLDW